MISLRKLVLPQWGNIILAKSEAAQHFGYNVYPIMSKFIISFRILKVLKTSLRSLLPIQGPMDGTMSLAGK